MSTNRIAREVLARLDGSQPQVRCPIWGEARSTSECEVCGGDIIKCRIYGRGEAARLDGSSE